MSEEKSTGADANATKRLEFLIKQTEIFDHFITNGVKQQNEKNPRNRRKKNGKQKENLYKNDECKPNEEKLVSFTKTPEYIKYGEMRAYQIEGLNWFISLMENGISGILGDEMGLGKTLQTISFLGYLKHYKNDHGPNLVIVPLSTLNNWLQEFERWCPSIRVVKFYGRKDERKAIKTETLSVGDFDVCVTTYETVMQETYILSKMKWRCVVMDEGHRIKNEKTLLANLVRGLQSDNRFLLTGTPLQNNLHELWALLNYLLPDVFNSAKDFDNWFNPEKFIDNQSVVKRLHSVLKPFLLRRLKSDVELGLLPKKEMKIFVSMTQIQRDLYAKILQNEVFLPDNFGNITKFRLNNILTHLIKCANHPYLFPNIEPGPPYDEENLIKSCGKMIVLDKLLAKLKAEGSRVLLFSRMTKVLNIIEDYCVYSGYKYCRLDGSSKVERREIEIQEFNKPKSDKFIFMLSTRAGGLGLNLATADTVIIFDVDWNPKCDMQAIDRCHRIGQTKEVRVFRLISEGTIDEWVDQKAESKLRLDEEVIQKRHDHYDPEKDRILRWVRYHAEKFMSTDHKGVVEEDIENILQQSEKIQKNKAAEMAKTGGMYQFEGEDYLQKRMEIQREQSNPENLIESKKRTRYKTTDLNDILKNRQDENVVKKANKKKPLKSSPNNFVEVNNNEEKTDLSEQAISGAKPKTTVGKRKSAEPIDDLKLPKSIKFNFAV